MSVGVGVYVDKIQKNRVKIQLYNGAFDKNYSYSKLLKRYA